MKSILVLASDFLERMSNPAYGARVNETYALRFAELLESDDGEFESRLAKEIQLLDEPGALGPHAWMWLISWARANRLELDQTLTLALFDHWDSTALRATIVELATQSWEGNPPSIDLALSDFPNAWLRELVGRVVLPDGDEPGRDDPSRRPDLDRDDFRIDEPRRPQHSRADRVLLALLQAGTDIALHAAAALLREDFPGQEQQRTALEEYLDEMDEESSAELRSQLGLS